MWNFIDTTKTFTGKPRPAGAPPGTFDLQAENLGRLWETAKGFGELGKLVGKGVGSLFSKKVPFAGGAADASAVHDAANSPIAPLVSPQPFAGESPLKYLGGPAQSIAGAKGATGLLGGANAGLRF